MLFVQKFIKLISIRFRVSNTIKFNYYKLPNIGHFSKTAKQKLKKICDQ